MSHKKPSAVLIALVVLAAAVLVTFGLVGSWASKSQPIRAEGVISAFQKKLALKSLREKSVGEKFVADVVQGTAGIVAPNTAMVGTSNEVALVVSAAKAVEELRRALESVAEPDQVRAVEAVRLRKVMRATLRGQGFEITPLGSEEQTGVLDADTQWKWQVRPLRAGTLRLTVILTAVIRDDGVDRGRDEGVWAKDIVVQAVPVAPLTWRQWIAAVWSDYKPPASWIYGTLVTGLAALIWRWWANRRRKKPKAGFRAMEP